MTSNGVGTIPATRALIVDDHGLYRLGLSLLLRDECGFDSVAEASSLDEAVDAFANEGGFALALFDLFMPGMAGSSCLQPLRRQYPQTKLVVISASENRSDVLGAIASGLNGFIPKMLPDQEITSAIKHIMNAQIFVPSLFCETTACQQFTHAAEPVQLLRGGYESGQLAADLTPRQRDVLEGIQRGWTNKEIARKLAIAEGTVKIHLAGLFTAFGVRNRTELALRNRVSA